MFFLQIFLQITTNQYFVFALKVILGGIDNLVDY